MHVHGLSIWAAKQFAAQDSAACFRAARLAAGSELELTVPACINKYLRQYQRGGVRFLMRQYANNLGGFLADVSPCLTRNLLSVMHPIQLRLLTYMLPGSQPDLCRPA